MHEQSETVRRPDGRWINVYGRRTPKAGKQLPGTADYPTMEEAVKAARERSESYQEEPIEKKKRLKTILEGD